MISIIFYQFGTALLIVYFELNLQFARECLDAGAKAVKPGVTTDEIDRIVHKVCIRNLIGNGY